MNCCVNQVRRGLFLDSVVLMQVSRTVAALPGVEDAALMMGTPANQEILENSDLLVPDGESAGGGDLIVAIRAEDETAATAAMDQAVLLLDQPAAVRAASAAVQPRTLRSALRVDPTANLALISVPGDFAAAEARKALRAGLHVMIFSDNVSLDDEIALKLEARQRELLVMGPDCGTAILGGTPLAFANRVPMGDIGIIGASGTGIQEVSCLIAQAGAGISHAIGVGGRDMSDEVGGISTLTSLKWLDADPKTRHIVLLSKTPSTAVVKRISAELDHSRKSFTVCFLGADDPPLPANVVAVRTLRAAAASASGFQEDTSGGTGLDRPLAGKRKWVRGFFSGGSLAAEAQVIFLDQGVRVASNAPIQGAHALSEVTAGHTLLDLGDDQYTRGRPHPMIDPAVRDEPLRQALDDPTVGAVFLDIVIGYGASEDPAAHVAQVLDRYGNRDPVVIASVTGTEEDPQVLSRQVSILESAGVWVRPSNAAAAEAALACIAA
jgi:FdrA protein